ncbi:MAG: hypothetical protein AAGA99_11345 [Actinomycetota bacterium]
MAERVDRGARALGALLAAALLAAGCTINVGGDSDDADETTTTTVASTTTTPGSADTTEAPSEAEPPATTEAASATTEATAPETTERAGEPAGGADPCSTTQAPAVGAYVVSGIPADDPDGGLVARRFPGAAEEQLDVLPEGTVVDVFDPADCAVVGGGVWFFIGTQQLPVGGWVNSRFLAAAGDGAGPPDAGEDDFDVPATQRACIYDGDGAACDLLVTFGIGTAEDNYGVGNSYSQAPDDAIVDLCTLEGDTLACGEGELRGIFGGE